MSNKIIILTAPSGSGKSTIAKSLMKTFPKLSFSVSATTRQARAGELDNVHYNFMSLEEFQSKIHNNEFAEWEHVYKGKYYGTLKTEIEKIWARNEIPLLDIDVNGAINIHKSYPTETYSIFIEVPLELLRERLMARGSETPASLQERLNKASAESRHKHLFSKIIENIDLEKAVMAAKEVVKRVIEKDN